MNILGFRFLRVNNDELMAKYYRLRYEIYCHETHFLEPEEYPEGIEKDKFDEHSIHFVAIDQDDNVVGTLRLIRDSDHGFPLEKHCPNYDHSKIDFPRSQLAEISRLTVAKNWRRRKNDGLYGMGSYHSTPEDPIPDSIQQRRKRPIIVFGLYKIMYMESKREGITHWYAAMEQKLFETLKKFFFVFEAIGPEHDYYGPVTPFLGEIANIEKILYKEKAEVMHLMAYGLERKYMPKLGFAFPLKNFITVNAAKMVGKI